MVNAQLQAVGGAGPLPDGHGQPGTTLNHSYGYDGSIDILTFSVSGLDELQ